MTDEAMEKARAWIEANCVREALVLCENSLSCFIDSKDFDVTVGGNPIVVDAMLGHARVALNRAREAIRARKP